MANCLTDSDADNLLRVSFPGPIKMLSNKV